MSVGNLGVMWLKRLIACGMQLAVRSRVSCSVCCLARSCLLVVLAMRILIDIGRIDDAGGDDWNGVCGLGVRSLFC